MKKLIFTILLIMSGIYFVNAQTPRVSLQLYDNTGTIIIDDAFFYRTGNYGTRVNFSGINATVYRCEWSVKYEGNTVSFDVLNGNTIFWCLYDKTGNYTVEVKVFYIDINGNTGTITQSKDLNFIRMLG